MLNIGKIFGKESTPDEVFSPSKGKETGDLQEHVCTDELPEGIEDCVENIRGLPDDLEPFGESLQSQLPQLMDAANRQNIDMHFYQTGDSCTETNYQVREPNQESATGEQLNESSTEEVAPETAQKNQERNEDQVGTQNDDEPENINTRNRHLEGKHHPESGVLFERKTVEDSAGRKVDGVFPKFESQFEFKLPEKYLDATDSVQEKKCNDALKKWCEENPDEAKKKFTDDQLEDIKHGDTPEGYVWHHNEDKGCMQLVDARTHSMTGHTGGRSIWGGGTDNRQSSIK